MKSRVCQDSYHECRIQYIGELKSLVPPNCYYTRTPLFRTRLIRSPRYFEERSNSLGFTLMFSVIYYQLFRTRLFRIPRYFELIVLSLHLK